MGVKKDFELFCDLIGMPKKQRSKEFDNLKKAAGRLAENWVYDEYEKRGYRVIPHNQKVGGFDFYVKKTNQYKSPDLPDEMLIEVKINTSNLTKKQKTVYLEVIEKGGNYRIIRHNIPLMISDWLTWNL